MLRKHILPCANHHSCLRAASCSKVIQSNVSCADCKDAFHAPCMGSIMDDLLVGLADGGREDGLLA